MPKVEVRLTDGTAKEIEGEPGISLMEAIRASGVDELLALCGGGLSCGTCHVYVLDQEKFDALPERDVEEQELLESFETYTERSRLSCQLELSAVPDGLHVEIAPSD